MARTKSIQMGFRTTPELKKAIEDAAWSAGVSAQRWIEEAVEMRLRELASKDAPVITASERRLLDEALTALRGGDPDLVDLMTRSIRAAGRSAPASPGARGGRRIGG